MIRRIINNSSKLYGLKLKSYVPISDRTYKCKCEGGKYYFVKQTALYSQEKYKFLYNQGIDNILYPIKNVRGEFITRDNGNRNFYITNFIPDFYMLNEVKSVNLANELTTLHKKTAFKRQLTPYSSRKKMDEIFLYLQYKFSVLELYIRTLEARKFDEYSITILKNYHIILDTKKIIEKLQRKTISDIRDKKSIYFSFIHNNPKLEHLLYSQGDRYLISLEKSKIGVPSLDMAKFYLENEHLNIDMKNIIEGYFADFDEEFHFDYFCFLVLVYYLKGIIMIDKDYVSSQSFLFATQSIKKFLIMFKIGDYQNKT